MIGKAGFPARRITSVEVDYLVVAGGGRGGIETGVNFAGGGGGAGGLLSGSVALARGVAVTVTVGAGGPFGSGSAGDDGENSVFGDVEAIGGGGGGNGGSNGRSGGSGGGGGQPSSGTTSGGAGTEGQGSAGGGGNDEGAGNGGGAGTSSSIAGTATSYAAGGLSGDGETPPANSGSGGRGGKVVTTGSIVVSGAGTAAANGTYVPDGTANGRTRYRLGSTDYTIVWVEYEGPLGVWELRDGGVAMYFVGESTAKPANPSSTVSGAAPAPTIAADITTTSDLPGADGVVVIAYPDTLPALTVGEGLTFNTPTRSGFRVYRFTSGTGTVTMP